MQKSTKKTAALLFLALVIFFGGGALVIIAEHNTVASGFTQTVPFHRYATRLLDPVAAAVNTAVSWLAGLF